MQLPLTDPDTLFEELLQDLPPETVVYDLFREFSALASTRGLLFGSFSHAHHIPQHVAAGRTL
jgi:Tfp pilus assembly protein PilO